MISILVLSMLAVVATMPADSVSLTQLAPHVIETEKPALANVFEVPSGYVVVVALAGARPSIPVTLRNLKLEGWRAEAMVPGEKAWKPVPVTFSRNDAQMKVSLKRGVVVVRLVRP